MGKLTILSERAFGILKVMFAELSFILLLKSVELSLISIEVVIVWLLSEVSHDFSWWVVKISWSSLCIVTLALIARLLTSWIVLLCLVIAKHRSVISRLSRVIGSPVQINLLVLLWRLRIGWPLLLMLSFLGLVLNPWLVLGLFFLFALLRSVTNHFLESVWF